jgi:hypothetical protein
VVESCDGPRGVGQHLRFGVAHRTVAQTVLDRFDQPATELVAARAYTFQITCATEVPVVSTSGWGVGGPALDADISTSTRASGTEPNHTRNGADHHRDDKHIVAAADGYTG